MRGGGRHIFTKVQIMVEYRTINMEEYPRREHFRYFSAMPVPTFGITARVDVTGLVRFCRERRCSFYMAMTHIACLAANGVPELRRRSRDGGIIEYAKCGTSHIELLPDETYCYCTLWHDMDWDEFIPYAEACRKRAVSAPVIEEDVDVDALYFITTVPWISYEQVSMPITSPVDDNPRFCWGRYEENHRGRLMLPFTLNANHALMDGVHAGAFYRRLQEELDKV